MDKKKYNLIYRLRKKGYTVLTRQRTIESESTNKYLDIRQIKRLIKEYHFVVQFKIPK